MADPREVVADMARWLEVEQRSSQTADLLRTAVAELMEAARKEGVEAEHARLRPDELKVCHDCTGVCHLVLCHEPEPTLRTPTEPAKCARAAALTSWLAEQEPILAPGRAEREQIDAEIRRTQEIAQAQPEPATITTTEPPPATEALAEPDQRRFKCACGKVDVASGSYWPADHNPYRCDPPSAPEDVA